MTTPTDRESQVVPTCYRHPDRETYVRCSRCERPICPDCMRSAAVGFQCPECVRDGARTQRVARTPFGGRVAATARVTYTLIVINVVVFAITALGGTALGLAGSSSSSRLYDYFAVQSTRLAVGDGHGGFTVVAGIAQGEFWRLFTAMFLHFGVLHILFNMYALYILGPPLERLLGWTRYLALYLLAGLAGSAASYAFGPLNQQSAGASGAIFGLFGAYLVIARKMRVDSRQILALIGLNLVISVVVPQIDLRGHLGGLVGGLAVAAVLVYAPAGPRRTPVQVAGLALVGLVIVAMVAARTLQLTG